MRWRDGLRALPAPSCCISIVTMNRSCRYILLLAASLAAPMTPAVAPASGAADLAAIAARQRSEKKSFSDSDIVEGFMKAAFGAEYHLAGRVDRIRKYEVPGRVFADGTRPDGKARHPKT